MKELDQKIEQILCKRLQELLSNWISEFKSSEVGQYIDRMTVLEIKIINQTIILDPPLQEGRALMYRRLHDHIELICGLQRVESSRYDKFKEKDQNRETTYKTLLTQMEQGFIESIYGVLEQHL